MPRFTRAALGVLLSLSLVVLPSAASAALLRDPVVTPSSKVDDHYSPYTVRFTTSPTGDLGPGAVLSAHFIGFGLAHGEWEGVSVESNGQPVPARLWTQGSGVHAQLAAGAVIPAGTPVTITIPDGIVRNPAVPGLYTIVLRTRRSGGPTLDTTTTSVAVGPIRDRLYFNSPRRETVAGRRTGPLLLSILEGSNHQPLITGSGLTVYFTVSSPTARLYLTPEGGEPVRSARIMPGQHTIKLYFEDSRPGTAVVVALSPYVRTPAAQAVTVLPLPTQD